MGEQVEEQVEEQAERLVGKVAHFYDKIRVAAVKLTDSIKVGDAIHIRGHTTDLRQTLDSLQIEHDTVQSAGAGDDVGLRVADVVREGDKVYVVE